MNRLPRIIANPLAQQHEQRHAATLDEIHRLIVGYDLGSDCMPHGIEYDDDLAMRQATDAECEIGTIDIITDLKFNLAGKDVANAAASSLERFAADLVEIASCVRKFNTRNRGDA